MISREVIFELVLHNIGLRAICPIGGTICSLFSLIAKARIYYVLGLHVLCYLIKVAKSLFILLFSQCVTISFYLVTVIYICMLH